MAIAIIMIMILNNLFIMVLQAFDRVSQQPDSPLFGTSSLPTLFLKPLPAEFLLVLATSLNSSNEDLLTLSALDMIHVCMYVCVS